MDSATKKVVKLGAVFAERVCLFGMGSPGSAGGGPLRRESSRGWLLSRRRPSKSLLKMGTNSAKDNLVQKARHVAEKDDEFLLDRDALGRENMAPVSIPIQTQPRTTKPKESCPSTAACSPE